MKTKMVKKTEVQRKWYAVDVSGKVLGRAASEIAVLLMGKDRVDYTAHVDNGSGVIALNCGKIRVTGNKASQKIYKRFSGYPGGQKVTIYKTMLEKDPKHILRHAVRGMLPKSKLGARMLKRLKLYVGDTHSHTAQKPEEKKL